MKIIFNLLQKEDLQEMTDIKNRLSKYNRYIKLFDIQFEKARKESIFEFSIISLSSEKEKILNLLKDKEKNVLIDLKQYYFMEQILNQ